MLVYTVQDLINEINRRCKKRDYDEEEEEEEEEIPESLEGTFTSEEELPFEDVLAEKRRQYSIKDEFVLLLYNDILQYFIPLWHGHYLRKREKPKIEDQDEEGEIMEDDYYGEIDIEKSESEKTVPFYKLQLKDEFVDISFVNGNTYVGRVSRKSMEGEGLYVWNNGIRYKGEFEANEIKGRGFLEWCCTRWYQGELCNGFRHGRGTMVDKDHGILYIGQWFMGHKHGKGYCRYQYNDSYDGDWTMGKRNGVGYRIYQSGARYIGEWKNDLRHGVGTMAWPNGDVYRGEWKNGKMHGSVEYSNESIIQFQTLKQKF